MLSPVGGSNVILVRTINEEEDDQSPISSIISLLRHQRASLDTLNLGPFVISALTKVLISGILHDLYNSFIPTSVTTAE